MIIKDEIYGKEKLKIGVDVDEVLAGLMEPLVRFYNDKFGTSLSRESFLTFKLWDTWKGTEEEAKIKIYNFFNSNYFEEIMPLNYSQEGVDFLTKNNELIVITSRPDYTKRKTFLWLEKHFPKKFSEVYFTDEWSNNGGGRKEDVCRKLGIDVLIEDDLEKAKPCCNVGTKVLLLDCPWNKCEEKDLLEGIERVYGWREIYGRLK